MGDINTQPGGPSFAQNCSAAAVALILPINSATPQRAREKRKSANQRFAEFCEPCRKINMARTKFTTKPTNDGIAQILKVKSNTSMPILSTSVASSYKIEHRALNALSARLRFCYQSHFGSRLVLLGQALKTLLPRQPVYIHISPLCETKVPLRILLLLCCLKRELNSLPRAFAGWP